MKQLFAYALRSVGILRYHLLTKTQSTYPDPVDVPDGLMVIVDDGGVKKWACFRCPGGCGSIISLSLNRDRRPRWGVSTDFWGRPTVEPSIHQTNFCGCHFWIRNGQIEWCRGGHPRCC